jgi:hypothetical protein
VNKVPNEYPEPKKGTVDTRKLEQDHIEFSLPQTSSEPQLQKRILVIDDNPDIVLD